MGVCECVCDINQRHTTKTESLSPPHSSFILLSSKQRENKDSKGLKNHVSQPESDLESESEPDLESEPDPTALPLYCSSFSPLVHSSFPSSVASALHRSCDTNWPSVTSQGEVGLTCSKVTTRPARLLQPRHATTRTAC